MQGTSECVRRSTRAAYWHVPYGPYSKETLHVQKRSQGTKTPWMPPYLTALPLSSQARAKKLRRICRVLLSAPADRHLTGVYELHVHPAHDNVSAALGEVAAAHKHLRDAFSSGLGSGGWGVIQHAFDLRLELHMKQVRLPQC